MDRIQTDATPGTDPGETALQRSIDNYLRTRTDTYARSARPELQRWLAWLYKCGYDVDALQEDSDAIIRRYAQRIDTGGLAALTTTTYGGYFLGCLSYGVSDGLLDRNLAFAERATEELPDDSSERPAQQFWSDEQRQEIVRYTRDRAYKAVDEQGFDALAERRDHASLRSPRPRACAARRSSGIPITFAIVATSSGNGTSTSSVAWYKYWPRASAGNRHSCRIAPPTPSGSGAASLQDDPGDRDGTVVGLLREHDVAPPALTTGGVQLHICQLTEAAAIDDITRLSISQSTALAGT